MTDPVKILIVSYDGPDSGRKLIGATQTPEGAELLISMDFMKTMDHENFQVMFDRASVKVTYEDSALTKLYPIVEHGGDPEDSSEGYLVQESWLY